MTNSQITSTIMIAKAISKKEYFLHYQPQIAIGKSGEIEVFGAEGLIRWNNYAKDGVEGHIHPCSYIPFVEKTRQIIEIGKIVLLDAIKTLSQWEKMDSHKHLTLSVNISPIQLEDGLLVDFMAETLKSVSIDTWKLKLEITESLPLKDIEQCSKTILALKKLGLHIALDDFGTEYSSLSLLLQFAVDEIKVDKIFVSSKKYDITTSTFSREIVRFINNVSQAMSVSLIAEGIENKAQLDALIELGVNRFQGYYFSKPLSCDDFQEFVERYNISKRNLYYSDNVKKIS